MLFQSFFALTTLVAAVVANGRIVVPDIREPGDGFKANCGQTAFKLFTAEPTCSQQNLIDVAPGGPKHKPESCNFSLCNGIPFKDNKHQVKKFRADTQLPMRYSITTPHVGYANLSVVDTKTNKPIGAPLKVFDKFGETANNADELDWSFKMSNTGKKCSTPGNCVLQFWWHSDEAKETYVSCVDFVQ
ncbi:hypothetical protein EV426DRAFT_554297 [Tirmania nivea]|nr:hypothetical protein EV426DRAFT_554297 [Tirmania nivea]